MQNIKIVGMGCSGLFIICIGFIVYCFLKIDDYCNDEFFDFLHREDVRIEILKCSEFSNPLIPKTVKVASVTGEFIQINQFLSKNGFYQTEDYKGRLGYDVFKPYSDSIKKSHIKYFYDNDKMGLYMLYSNHYLFIVYPGSTSFQD